MTRYTRQERGRGHLWLLAPLFFLFFLLAGSTAAQAEETITLRFRTAAGEAISGLSDQTLSTQTQIRMPSVTSQSGVQGVPAFRPTLSGTITQEVLLPTNEWVTASRIRNYYREYGENGVLTLYLTDVCQVRYYSRDGGTFYGSDRVYQGTYYSLRSNPSPSNDLLYGWAKEAQANTEWRYFGASYTIQESMTLYAVDYVRISFRTSDGAQSEVYDGLEIKTKRNRSVTLPAIPSNLLSYSNLGWSRTQGASSPDYEQRQTIRTSQNLTLYACRRYSPIVVRFTDTNGLARSRAFYSLWKYTTRGNITLPRVPYKTGYVGLGWSTRRNQTTAEYKEGDTVFVSGNTRFYAVYRRAKSLTIRYYMDGPSDNKPEYTSMRQTVYEGSLLVLPEIPERAGYENQGWRLRISSTQVDLYPPGTRIRVTDNLRFYAQQEKAPSVTLYDHTGSFYRNIVTQVGSSCTLPSMLNPEGYTFLGWSTTPGLVVSEANPASVSFYEAGETFRNASEDTRLFAVVSQYAAEPSLLPTQMTVFDRSRYSHVVIVGDSRMFRLGQAVTVGQATGYDATNLTFQALGGTKLAYVEETALPRLHSLLQEWNSTQGLPVAVIFNHGVNDLSAVSGYINYMNSIAQELAGKNCRLFYVSVNPVNSLNIAKKNFYPRTEAQVRSFNAALRSGLSSYYTWIDTYSWLMHTGFSYDRGNDLGFDINDNDGLHYSVKTYKRILNRVMQVINRG